MRKDAPGHPPGFSLVELLSAVAVAAILLGLALPGFQETLRRQRAASGAHTVYEGLETLVVGWAASINTGP